MILGLDIASVVGWAFWRPGMLKPRYGRWKLPLARDDKNETAGRQSLALRNSMRDFHALNSLEGAVVVIEAASLFGRDDRHRAMMALGKANEAETTALELKAVPVFTDHQTLMSWWVGDAHIRSEPGKRASIAAANARGWAPQCDNAADALGLITHYAGYWKIDVPWNAAKAERRAHE